MLVSKFFLILLLIQTNVAFAQSAKLKNNKTLALKKEKPTDDFSFESVSISYKQTKGEKVFSSLELGLSAFGRFIEIISPSGKKIVLDCVPTDNFTKWKCLSGCEGGELKIGFHKNIKFDIIKIESFKLLDRKCDGTESENDVSLQTSKDSFYKITNVTIAK